MATKITNLPDDLLRHIFCLVAKSSDGAVDIAKSLSVSKSFLDIVKTKTVYKAVCFKDVDAFEQLQRCQNTNGLIYSCAEAGNVSAQILLAQVIILSSCELENYRIKSAMLHKFRDYRPTYICGRLKARKDYILASFMANFTPGRGPRPFMFHWELVKVFLSNCNREGIVRIYRHIRSYVVYFTGKSVTLCPITGHPWTYVFLVRLSKFCNKYLQITKLAMVRASAIHAFDRLCLDFSGF